MTLHFLNLVPIIFHLITPRVFFFKKKSAGRGNEMTRFYGIIHQELIEAFIQFSADKMLVTINNNKIHQRRICFAVMEMAHFHPGEFLVKKTLQFKKGEGSSA